MATRDLQLTNKAISAVHASATSLAAALLLKYGSWEISDPPKPGPREDGILDDSGNPMIFGRSSLANALTAWETIYLLYDTAFMVHETRVRRGLASVSAAMGAAAKDSPVILTHHVLLASAFLTLQSYIIRGKERGLWVITAFMLMNASNPLMHARWWLRTRKGRRSALLDLAFISTFAVTRFGLVAWVLHKYGWYHGLSLMQVFARLRVPCQMGTATLVGLNGVWWVALVVGFVRRLAKTRKNKTT